MVYNYTVPRGPIAAMYSSPGPVYKLPGLCGQPQHDPRSVHTRGPAFPFGNRHGKFRDDCSPGPCYKLDSRTYRNGRDGTPSYSLYQRPKDVCSYTVPGPGAYKPEDAGQNSKPRAAAYSFGLRHFSRRTDNTPGPNAYGLDDMLGPRVRRSDKRVAPVCSITGRSKVGSFAEDLQKTPGPGAYNTTQPETYKSAPPKISMTSRNPMPGDSTQKPGPGAYQPELVILNKRQAPNASFGIRHSQYKGEFITDADCE